MLQYLEYITYSNLTYNTCYSTYNTLLTCTVTYLQYTLQYLKYITYNFVPIY